MITKIAADSKAKRSARLTYSTNFIYLITICSM